MNKANITFYILEFALSLCFRAKGPAIYLAQSTGIVLTQVSGPAIEVGRFEAEALSTKSNLMELINLSGRWIDTVHWSLTTRLIT